MMEALNSHPKLAEVHRALTDRYGDSVIESTFEKEELSVKVKREHIYEILSYMKNGLGFNALNDIIALDNLNSRAEGEKRFSILYQLYRFPGGDRIRLKIDVDENEYVMSVCEIYKSANWAEREILDMFGIMFEGHPDPRRIYMPEDFDGYPLRKDFPLQGKN